MKTSHSSARLDWQSRSLPGMPPDSSRPLRRVASRAFRAAIRAAAAWIDLRMTSRASVGCDSSQLPSWSFTTRCTNVLASVLPSLVLV